MRAGGGAWDPARRTARARRDHVVVLLLVALLIVMACALVRSGPVHAQRGVPVPPPPGARPFDQWLSELVAEARQRGFSDEVLQRTLLGLQPLPQVLERDRTQPEVVITFEEYLARRLTPEAVRQGQALARDHGALLERVREAYGVPPAIIVAIWGMESKYGRHTGDIPVFQSLATLAWSPRRGSFFRRQLFDALTIVARGHIEASRMVGSWAGAMGQPQFMPSSYLAYAVDFDGDGRRDLWTSLPDIFASIANYLQRHGWRPEEAWGREVRVPPEVGPRIASEVAARTSGCAAMRNIVGPAALDHWKRLGLIEASGGELLTAGPAAGLVRAGQRQFLVHASYDALLRYNCAHLYALTVALLADQIQSAPVTEVGVEPSAQR